MAKKIRLMKGTAEWGLAGEQEEKREKENWHFFFQFCFVVKAKHKIQLRVYQNATFLP